MNIYKHTSRTYRFCDIELDVKIGGKRAHIARSAEVVFSYFPDDPVEDQYLLDIVFRGWDCKANGSIDKRSSGRGYVQFPDYAAKLRATLSLVSQTDDTELIEYVRKELEQSELRAR